ncbi:alpha/beta hydrolase family protein [Asticcacaulis excentricus]|uniref:Prolyl oligopeptidase family protein n=1 Tax=Asticcacaulis excentricus TaxID=78587 RepID=A0A3G9G0L5_9CAUL|nr:prolyl oligopeptidase family serine peptidase [Asticcacaulis excentricus]BBF80227.1 prolyl oligopeptidase family protein [Asticcacaulis excentricus]
MAFYLSLHSSHRALAAAFFLSSAVAVPVAVLPTDADAEAAPPSAEDFGRLPALSSLTLSPDGKHIAAVSSQDGKTSYITVWETSDMSKPIGIGSDPRVRFMGVNFVKDERLSVTVRQIFDYGSLKTFLFKNEFTDLTGSKWFKGTPERKAQSEAEEINRATSSAQVVSTLPNDPENVLVAGDQGAIYKSNLKTGKITLYERLGERDGSLFYDFNGVLRAKSLIKFENGNSFAVQMVKDPDTNEWKEIFRAYFKEREIPSIVGLTKDPNIIMVRARRGQDHTAIYHYDIRSNTFKDVVFAHPSFDVGGVLLDHRTGEIIAFSYMADRPSLYYVDEKLDATMKGIEQALGLKTEVITWKDLATSKESKLRLPDGASLSLVDYSSDFKTLIVRKSGPSTPDEYYLYIDGKGLQGIGSSRPWLDTSLLGEGHLEQFTARDGRPIPALVYKPKVEKYGKGPYPTLIIPHGGPWARDYLDWSVITPWAQYFVARGYAVAMPQYRGSDGWGWAQWTAGDNKWGEEMSDDMDDVALGMVKQGVADRNRLAMHGYSFGGYSAMAAIVRPNPIYQCAISGAGPSSPKSMQRETQDSRFTREFQRPFVDGLDAKANVANASIPILIYHGDRDTNVLPGESKVFYEALISAKKKAEYVLFKDMGHEANKWGPEHEIKLLNMVDNYLKTDCKAGGL